MIRSLAFVTILLTAAYCVPLAHAQIGGWVAMPGGTSGTNFGYGRISTRANTRTVPAAWMAAPQPFPYTPPAVTFAPSGQAASCCAPTAPAAEYYTPNAPPAAYYGTAPPVSYVSPPVAGVYATPAAATTYYAPAVVWAPAYVPGQPVRNVFRAIQPY